MASEPGSVPSQPRAWPWPWFLARVSGRKPLGCCSRAVPELTQPPAASSNWNLEQGSGDATRLTGWKWVSHEMLAQPLPQLPPHPKLPQGLRAPSAQPWEVPIAGWPPSWSPQTVSALHLTKMGQGLGGLARPSGVPQRHLSGVNATSFSAFQALIPSPSSWPCVSLFFMLSPKPLHLASSVPFHCSLFPAQPALLQSCLCPSPTQSPSMVPHSLQYRVHSPEPAMT